MQVLIYKNSSGRQPYVKWLEELDKPIKKRAEALVERLGENPDIGQPLKQQGLFELKVKFRRAGYRVYYTIVEGTAYLLGGGSKQTQEKDISAAVHERDLLLKRLNQPQEERSR